MAGKRVQKKYFHRADENWDQIFHHEFFLIYRIYLYTQSHKGHRDLKVQNDMT